MQTIGSEICIDSECFYVISSDEDSVTMISKYNLYVGGVFNNGWTSYGNEATGIQSSTMLAYVSDQVPMNGSILFSSTNYWSNSVSSYPEYVYNSNSMIYNYIENYKSYLVNHDVVVEEARLIKYEELETLGCSIKNSNCLSAPKWVYATSYWTGSASNSDRLFRVIIHSGFGGYIFDNHGYGVRPVIVIPKSEF